MIKVIFTEDLYDKEFIESRCENFDELKNIIGNIKLEIMCKIANIPLEDVRKAARLYAKANSAAIVYSMGITQHTTGTDNVLSLANLAMFTGNIGRPGTGVNPLRGQNNVQGACDVGGLPNVYPGYQAVTDQDHKAKFEKEWNVSQLDDKIGLTVVEMMNGAHDGNIKGMFIMGENPVLSDPNVSHVREALKKIDFLVVLDIFMTETAKYADVVLPGVSFAEKAGTFTNTERRVQRIRPAITIENESKPDWVILQKLLKLVGIEKSYSSVSEIMDEIASISPIYGGIAYNRIDKEGLQWPCPTIDHPGTKILHSEQFKRGKGKFHPIEYLDPAEMPDEDYPFILTTGRMLYHWHTGEMTHRSSGLHKRVPREVSQVNSEDARRLNIKNDDLIVIESRRGKVETIAKTTNRIQPGVVFMSFHDKNTPTNILTNDKLDPIAKIPEFKVSAIKMYKK